MRCFEFVVARTSVGKNGGPHVPDHTLMFAIPDEAVELLKPILIHTAKIQTCILSSWTLAVDPPRGVLPVSIGNIRLRAILQLAD